LPPRRSHDVNSVGPLIEHFRSPREALHIHRLLARGPMYVECPNLGAPFRRGPSCFNFAHITISRRPRCDDAQRCGSSWSGSFHARSEFANAVSRVEQGIWKSIRSCGQSLSA